MALYTAAVAIPGQVRGGFNHLCGISATAAGIRQAGMSFHGIALEADMDIMCDRGPGFEKKSRERSRGETYDDQPNQTGDGNPAGAVRELGSGGGRIGNPTGRDGGRSGRCSTASRVVFHQHVRLGTPDRRRRRCRGNHSGPRMVDPMDHLRRQADLPRRDAGGGRPSAGATRHQ
jgi:hypothetical protein